MATYEEYRAMLPVMKHRLDDELEVQAQIMEQIITETVRQNSRLLECKLNLEKLEGRLLAEYKEDDPKMTVAQVEAKVKRDPERDKAWQIYLSALSEVSKWQGLQDAWRQKGFSIKTLADLYATQYFQLSSHQVNERTRRGNDPEVIDNLRRDVRIAGRSSVATAVEARQRQLANDEPLSESRPRRRSINE
jgi:hypothetical protein